MGGAVQTREQTRGMRTEKSHNLLVYASVQACLASHNECLTMATLQGTLLYTSSYFFSPSPLVHPSYVYSLTGVGYFNNSKSKEKNAALIQTPPPHF